MIDIKNMSKEQKASVIRIMNDLMAHEGWKLLSEIAREEASDYNIKVCDPTYPLNIDMHHYNRGIMWASHLWLQMPQMIVDRVTNSVPIEELLMKTTNPAKAGER